MEVKMITVLKDNTINTYYTICKKCNSEFAYNYADVEFEELGFSYIVNKRVTCPICKFKTLAELECKNKYTNNSTFLPYIKPIHSCCGGNENE